MKKLKILSAKVKRMKKYAREQRTAYRKLSQKLAREAAKEGDHIQWDLSRLALGQSFAFSQVVGYLKGFKS